MKKKLEKMRIVGRSWGGDIYETMDGKRYWLGDRNGPFLQRQQTLFGPGADGKDIGAAAPRADHYIDFQPSGVSFLEMLMGMAAFSAVLALLFFVGITAMFFYAMIALWPQMISLLVGDFARGAINIPLILMAIALVFLLVYFILCLRETVKTGAVKSKQYAVLCTVCIAVPYLLFDLFSGGFSLFSIPLHLINGAVYALLPVVILSCVEFRVTGGRHMIRSIAQMVCRGKSLYRLIFALLGVIALIVTAVFLAFFLPAAGILKGLPLVLSFLLAGVFFLLISIHGKA